MAVTGGRMETDNSVLGVHDGQLRQWASWQRHTSIGNTRYQCSIRNQSHDCIVIKPRKTQCICNILQSIQC